MRLPVVLALLLAVPLVTANASSDPAGDERVGLSLAPLMLDEPVALPGACHAAAVDIRAIEVTPSAQTLVVSLTVANAASRDLVCPGTMREHDAPRFGAELFKSYRTYGVRDPADIILTSGGGMCWAYDAQSSFFWPIDCGFTLVGNTATWTVPRGHVSWLPLESMRTIGRAAADADGMLVEDFAG